MITALRECENELVSRILFVVPESKALLREELDQFRKRAQSQLLLEKMEIVDVNQVYEEFQECSKDDARLSGFSRVVMLIDEAYMKVESENACNGTTGSTSADDVQSDQYRIVALFHFLFNIILSRLTQNKLLKDRCGFGSLFVVF